MDLLVPNVSIGIEIASVISSNVLAYCDSTRSYMVHVKLINILFFKLFASLWAVIHLLPEL